MNARILLVDDSPANLMSLEAVLEPLGEPLTCVESGEQALRKLLLDEFALALLDVQMPGIDGFQVASMIRQHPATAHLPIIFVTASSYEPSQVFEGYERGAVDYLVKPVDPHILRAKVAVFVDLYKKGKLIEHQAELLRQREREALERTIEHQFRSLTESIAWAIWAADSTGDVFYANRAARQLGPPAASSCPASFLGAVHPDDVGRAQDAWTTSLASGAEFDLECRLQRRADGVARWHLVRGALQQDEGGAETGWIVSASDIDDLKQAEHQLREVHRQLEGLNRAKDVFLASTSHELRSPLAAAMAQAELALVRLEGSVDRFPATAFVAIRRQIERTSRLVADLVDVGQIQAGRLSVCPEEMDLDLLLVEVVERLRAAAPRHTFQLLAPDAIRWTADAGRLDQILTNLLSNAVRYSPEGGSIELACWVEADQLHLEVRDQGIGIPPDKLEAIFDMFERAHGPGFGGLGLGLSIVRGIVEQHAGSISATSTGRPGEGSTFHVRLPRAPARTASTTPGAASRSHAASERVPPADHPPP